VLVGWMMGQPLSLDFQLFETAAVLMTVLMVNFLIIDGRSNWMVGLLLVAGYAVVALSFAMHSGSST
jgi:Ca2+:H+ antiporter